MVSDFVQLLSIPVISFLSLVVINLLQAWGSRHET
jgi:hypothetical protein